MTKERDKARAEAAALHTSVAFEEEARRLAERHDQESLPAPPEPSLAQTVLNLTANVSSPTPRTPSLQDWAVRLHAFYSIYSPGKAHTEACRTTLLKFEGKEHELFTVLYHKYQVRATARAAATLPPCRVLMKFQNPR
jgi:hypothetical protein